MNYRLAASAMIRIFVLEPFDPHQHPKGRGANHLHWMLKQISETEMSEGKANRWLGWAQCLATVQGYTSLEACKSLNLSCACDDEGCPHYNTLHIHETINDLGLTPAAQEQMDIIAADHDAHGDQALTIGFWAKAAEAGKAFTHCPGVVIGGITPEDVYDGFIAGVRWAKGLPARES